MEGSDTLKRCPRCAEDVRPEAVWCRYCQFEFESTPDNDLYSRWLRGNSPLLVPAAAFLYAVFQIYKVGDFENTTTLLQSSDLTTILIGVFLAQLPIALILLALVCCGWLISSARIYHRQQARLSTHERRLRTGDLRAMPLMLLTLLLLLSFFTSPWPMFVVSTVVAVTTLIIVLRPAPANRLLGLWTRRGIRVLAAILLLILIERPAIWAPLEAVTTKDNVTRVAYVLSDDGHWTTLLTPQWTGRLPEGDNAVSRLLTDDITSRQPCAADIYEARTFAPITRARPIQLVEMAIHREPLPPPLTPPCPDTP